MGIFDFFNSKPSVQKLTNKLVEHIFTIIQTEKGVRVEDAICVIATIVAERCIKIADEFSIDNHEFEPGSPVFSEKINEILFGPKNTEEWDDLPTESVFRQMKLKLNSHFKSDFFPPLVNTIESFAKNVGETEWGNLKLSVSEDNRPFILPLQAGYETRAFVEREINIVDDEYTLRVVINAMCSVLIVTRKALEPLTALTLTFEIINGMSKTATMTHKKMAELQAEVDKK